MEVVPDEVLPEAVEPDDVLPVEVVPVDVTPLDVEPVEVEPVEVDPDPVEADARLAKDAIATSEIRINFIKIKRWKVKGTLYQAFLRTMESFLCELFFLIPNDYIRILQKVKKIIQFSLPLSLPQWNSRLTVFAFLLVDLIWLYDLQILGSSVLRACGIFDRLVSLRCVLHTLPKSL